MNDWYIDRSKNFINPSLDPVLCYFDRTSQKKESTIIIADLIEQDVFNNADGNPYAALTRFRDHGLIDYDNRIGESAHDYIQGFISKDELIVDLLLKRPSTKKNAADIKPFVCICKVFDLMFDLGASVEDIYLSYEECYKYLYSCNTLEGITPELVDNILEAREECYHFVGKNSVYMKQNEVTNISIWFNALKNTPLFVGYDEEKTLLRPNQYQRDFFSFISINGQGLKKTPTNSNKELYTYYCDRTTGLNEIIPYTFKDNIIVRDLLEIDILLDYLFGIKKAVEFDFGYYFDSDCFGIYHPFVSIPRLAIRKICEKNKALGEQLYSALKLKKVEV